MFGLFIDGVGGLVKLASIIDGALQPVVSALTSAWLPIRQVLGIAEAFCPFLFALVPNLHFANLLQFICT